MTFWRPPVLAGRVGAFLKPAQHVPENPMEEFFMSEYSERFVKQTEALLHFQHDETLQETSPERLH